MSEEDFSWKGIEGAFLEKIADYSALSLKGRAPNNNYQHVLEKISESMIRFKKAEHLIKMIIRMIHKQVGVKHAGILLYREDKGAFILIDSKGEDTRRLFTEKTTLTAANPLVTIFTQEAMAPILDENGVVIRDHLEHMLADEEFLSKNLDLIARLKGVKEEMDKFNARICIPSYFKRKLLGILILGDKISGEKFNREEIRFFLMLSNNAAMAVSNAQLIENLQEKVREVEVLYEKFHSLFIRISIALATAIDARDPYTHGHTVRVTGYCLAMAEELQYSPEIRGFDNFRENLHVAALLHDVGKIGIPDNILHKKEELTPEEFEKIKEHPAIGATILYPIRELSDIVGGVRSHQERFDGTGYPDRLKGNGIPFLARIIAVADAFDAITSSRPYRPKRSQEEAIIEIDHCSGTQFDPRIAALFRRIYNRKRFANFI